MTAINHFTIDSVSGDISVFRSLAEEGLTRISQYTLRVIASDQGKCNMLDFRLTWDKMDIIWGVLYYFNRFMSLGWNMVCSLVDWLVDIDNVLEVIYSALCV